jgi:4-amino-4-deoxy-L-arabinose transferase-like glycosyltransferase
MIHAVLLLAISLPYLVNLGTSSIWDASEAVYAETPREMLTTGDYLAPQFNFKPRVQNPPLTYWIIAISYKAFGISEFAVRLPGALAAIGVILFTYGIARLLYNPRAALIAAMITAATARIFILARRLPIDIFLLFFLMATLFFLLRAILARKTHFWLCAYLFDGFGFLTKGPVALLIPAGACLIWAVWSRKLKLRETHLLSGAIVFLAIVLPWYLLIFNRYGWTYVAPFFLRDNLGRLAPSTAGPSRGLFYYIGVGATDFFPWSVLALCAFCLLWKYHKSEQPLKNLSFGLPVIWCVLTFVFFSLSKDKQESAIAPIYPVAAIIISSLLDRAMKKNDAIRYPGPEGASAMPACESSVVPMHASHTSWWIWAFSFQAVVLFAFSFLTFYVFRFFMPDILPVLPYIPSLLLVAGFILFIRSIFRRKLVQCFSVLLAVLWIMYLMCATIYLPALERFRPVKDLCRIIETQLNAGDEAGYFRTALPSMVFYLRRPIFEENNVAQMRRRLMSRKRVFCILTQKAYNSFAGSRDRDIYILARRPRFAVRLGTLLNAGQSQEEELLLISNRAGAIIKSAKDRPIS